MSKPTPWRDNWVVENELGGGGQGTTFLVRATDDSRAGVLKILKNQKSDQARRRMYREVANLKVLGNAGCRVPAVLESNTDEFESKDTPLYFVMQHIPGESLANAVAKTKGVTLERAAAIALDVCDTIDKAAKEQVLHRDLKPENILVRSIEPPDCVIVDYGLSFNQDDTDELTLTGEALDNRFLSLPERRVPGGDRRDPRSDLTGVCGLLYYCITGEPPVDLADANGRPPHRRPGRSVRERLAGDPRVSQLEAFFDKGFSTAIDARYQTISELVHRLNDVLSPTARRSLEDPLHFAKRAADIILKHDRKTQLGRYKEMSQGVVKTLNQVLSKYSANKVRPYLIGAFPPRRGGDWGYPDGVERLGVEFAAQVTVEHHRLAVVIAYEVYTRVSQCGVFRHLFRPRPGAKKPHGPRVVWDAVGGWECILWYEGLSGPDLAVIAQDFEACLVDAMQIIQQEIVR